MARKLFKRGSNHSLRECILTGFDYWTIIYFFISSTPWHKDRSIFRCRRKNRKGKRERVWEWCKFVFFWGKMFLFILLLMNSISTKSIQGFNQPSQRSYNVIHPTELNFPIRSTCFLFLFFSHLRVLWCSSHFLLFQSNLYLVLVHGKGPKISIHRGLFKKKNP